MKKFAISNLGKSVRWRSFILNPLSEGMIVGYNAIWSAIIVSFTNGIGWGKESLEGTDVILLDSPLNVSFWYIYPNEEVKWEVVDVVKEQEEKGIIQLKDWRNHDSTRIDRRTHED